MTMEFQILDAIQRIRTPVGDVLMPAISALGNAGILWIILAAALLMTRRTRRAGAVLACALCLDGILCNVILKPLVGRIRPFDVNTTVQLLIAPPTDASFPSGHTAAAFASVCALWMAGRKNLSVSAFVLAVLIAFSRMYLYVHYPTDILGGIVVGMLCGVLGYVCVRWIDNFKNIRREQGKP